MSLNKELKQLISVLGKYRILLLKCISDRKVDKSILEHLLAFLMRIPLYTAGFKERYYTHPEICQRVESQAYRMRVSTKELIRDWGEEWDVKQYDKELEKLILFLQDELMLMNDEETLMKIYKDFLDVKSTQKKVVFFNRLPEEKAGEALRFLAQESDTKTFNTFPGVVRVPSTKHPHLGVYFALPSMREHYLFGYHATNTMIAQNILATGIRPGNNGTYFHPKLPSHMDREMHYAYMATTAVVTLTLNYCFELVRTRSIEVNRENKYYLDLFIKIAREKAKESFFGLRFEGITQDLEPLAELRGASIEAIIPKKLVINHQNGKMENGEFKGYEILIKGGLPANHILHSSTTEWKGRVYHTVFDTTLKDILFMGIQEACEVDRFLKKRGISTLR